MNAQFFKPPPHHARTSFNRQAELKLGEVSAREMRNLFHDMNNCLMLIMLVSDKMEASQAPRTGCQSISEHTAPIPQNTQDALCVYEDQTAQIIRHNAVALRDMMHKMQQFMMPDAPQGGVSVAAEKWTIKELIAFTQHQQSQWQLLLPPDSELRLQLTPCDEGFVQIDAPSLARSLQNLIRNACEAYIYATQSEADATAPRASLLVLISGELQADHYVIFVQDNGPGIAADMQPYLFQEAVSTKVAHDFVYGQGLASAQDCLAAFGGQLELHHSDHQGSLFRLALPWNSSK